MMKIHLLGQKEKIKTCKNSSVWVPKSLSDASDNKAQNMGIINIKIIKN